MFAEPQPIRCALGLAAVFALGCTGNAPPPPSTATPTAEPEPQIVREPAVAGQFYPADPGELRSLVHDLISAERRVARAPVRAVLVPHAGYRFSAAVAAAAFRQLDPGFSRVVILAGNHNGKARFAGASVDGVTHYRVPGLTVKLAPAAAALRARPGFVDAPEAHTMHMIEVELPFLAEVNGAPFEIVPIVVDHLSRAEGRALARELSPLADARTRFVFSVDLSHYHPYEVASARDRACLEALSEVDLADVARCDTDATQLLLVMSELVAQRAWTPRLLKYQNSGDTAGDRERVVGYGAMAFEDELRLGAREGAALLALARASVEAQVREGRTPAVPEEIVARFPRLAARRGAFVTLEEGGRLRGCIGSLEAGEPLAADVIHNAASAAVRDSRFPPVQADELGALDLSISVLDTPRPLVGLAGDALVKKLAGEHPGVVLRFEGRRSTFLPEVWSQLPDPGDFLDHLCQKQGSPATCWRSPEARFEVYGAQHLGK